MMTVLSASDQELNKLCQSLSVPESEHTWQAMDHALTRLIQLMQSGEWESETIVQWFKQARLRDPVCQCLLTERTRLASTALVLISQLAVTLGSSFDALVDAYVPTVMKLTARTNKVFVMRAKEALQQIVTSTGASIRLLHRIKEPITITKSKQQKAHCVQLLHCLIQQWNNETSTSHLVLEEMLMVGWETAKSGVKDASPETREEAKKLFGTLSQMNPVKMTAWLEQADVSLQKAFGSSRPGTAIAPNQIHTSHASLSSHSATIPNKKPIKSPVSKRPISAAFLAAAVAASDSGSLHPNINNVQAASSNVGVTENKQPSPNASPVPATSKRPLFGAARVVRSAGALSSSTSTNSHSGHINTSAVTPVQTHGINNHNTTLGTAGRVSNLRVPSLQTTSSPSAARPMALSGAQRVPKEQRHWNSTTNTNSTNVNNPLSSNVDLAAKGMAARRAARKAALSHSGEKETSTSSGASLSFTEKLELVNPATEQIESSQVNGEEKATEIKKMKAKQAEIIPVKVVKKPLVKTTATVSSNSRLQVPKRIQKTTSTTAPTTASTTTSAATDTTAITSISSLQDLLQQEWDPSLLNSRTEPLIHQAPLEQQKQLLDQLLTMKPCPITPFISYFSTAVFEPLDAFLLKFSSSIPLELIEYLQLQMNDALLEALYKQVSSSTVLDAFVSSWIVKCRKTSEPNENVKERLMALNDERLNEWLGSDEKELEVENQDSMDVDTSIIDMDIEIENSIVNAGSSIIETDNSDIDHEDPIDDEDVNDDQESITESFIKDFESAKEPTDSVATPLDPWSLAALELEEEWKGNDAFYNLDISRKEPSSEFVEKVELKSQELISLELNNAKDGSELNSKLLATDLINDLIKNAVSQIHASNPSQRRVHFQLESAPCTPKQDKISYDLDPTPRATFRQLTHVSDHPLDNYDYAYAVSRLCAERVLSKIILSLETTSDTVLDSESLLERMDRLLKHCEEQNKEASAMNNESINVSDSDTESADCVTPKGWNMFQPMTKD